MRMVLAVAQQRVVRAQQDASEGAFEGDVVQEQ